MLLHTFMDLTLLLIQIHAYVVKSRKTHRVRINWYISRERDRLKLLPTRINYSMTLGGLQKGLLTWEGLSSDFISSLGLLLSRRKRLIQSYSASAEIALSNLMILSRIWTGRVTTRVRTKRKLISSQHHTFPFTLLYLTPGGWLKIKI